MLLPALHVPVAVTTAPAPRLQLLAQLLLPTVGCCWCTRGIHLLPQLLLPTAHQLLP